MLAPLEELSRQRPDRLLRLRGNLPGAEGPEAFELLIYRGISSSVSHPTAHDPDQSLLPEGATLESAELLAAPLNPNAEQRLAGPAPVDKFLDPESWL
ncbi:MAG: hypothetical protein RLZZ158_1115 [Cyanobacteriota bacterium]